MSTLLASVHDTSRSNFEIKALSVEFTFGSAKVRTKPYIESCLFVHSAYIYSL